MKTNLREVSFVFLAPVISGILLRLAYSTYDFQLLAWVALVPLLTFLPERRPSIAFLCGLISGSVFFGWLFIWMFQVQGYTLIHHAILFLYLGAYFGLFGLVLNLVNHRWGRKLALLSAPFIWVSTEYLRSNAGFMSHPWALISHSQYQQAVATQIASITGSYGVSFLVVAMNSAISLFIVGIKKRLQEIDIADSAVSKGGFVAASVCSASPVAAALVYGFVCLNMPIQGKEIKLSLVQGNIEQSKKWDPDFAYNIKEIYSDLSKKAAEAFPDLIVWPEAATPRSIKHDVKLYSWLLDTSKQTGTKILIGSSGHHKFMPARNHVSKFTNSAFLVDPHAPGALQRYDKIRLVPFGEYMPYKGVIPWSFLKIPDPGTYVAGTEYTLFEAKKSPFAVNICWEVAFPELVRFSVKSGAQFVINISNEAWFGATAAPYQMLAMSVFRAVENRVYVVRCANTGVSCFIDPHGRIVNRLTDSSGKDLFVRGVLTDTVIPRDAKTIYTRYGDWFAWLSIFLSLLLLASLVVPKKSGTSFRSFPIA